MQGRRNNIHDALAKFTKTESCWIWIHQPDSDGYGRFWLSSKNLLAHRVIYELLRKPIPRGLELDHLCRNRICVNPDHLEPVTCQVNLLRGQTHAAKNAQKTYCSKGHELKDSNLYLRKTGRSCRTCHRERMRRFRVKYPEKCRTVWQRYREKLRVRGKE